jgi:hypothetical protein
MEQLNVIFELRGLKKTIWNRIGFKKVRLQIIVGINNKYQPMADTIN